MESDQREGGDEPRLAREEFQGKGPDACFAAKQTYKAPSPRKLTSYPIYGLKLHRLGRRCKERIPSVIKRISLLVLAAMLVATMAMGAVAAPAFADCVKERGTWVCTTTTSGKNEKQPKFQETTTTTTKGNLKNFS